MILSDYNVTMGQTQSLVARPWYETLHALRLLPPSIISIPVLSPLRKDTGPVLHDYAPSVSATFLVGMVTLCCADN